MDEDLQLTRDELVNPTVLRMYGAHVVHRNNDFVQIGFPNAHSATSYISAAGYEAKARFRELPASMIVPAVIVVDLRDTW